MDEIASDTATVLRLTTAIAEADKAAWARELDLLVETGTAMTALCCAASLLLKACTLMGQQSGHDADYWLQRLVLDLLDNNAGQQL